MDAAQSTNTCGVVVPRIGLLWMAISAWGYATASLFARLANNTATSWQVVFARCVIQWGLATAFQTMYHPTVDLWGPATVRRFLVLRGCVGIGGLSCFYYAIAHMPLSDATVVMFTSPVWTCLFAWALLGEKMGLREAVSIAISIVGICFIAKPTFLFPRPASATDPNSGGDSSTTFALAIGVLGSVFAACAYVVIRFVGTDVHFITQVHAFAVAGMLVSPVAILVFEGESLLANSTAWGWMVLCGVAGFLAQCFMSRGLQLEKAGPASLMRNVDVLFAFAYQAMFIDANDITVLSLAGAGCIIVSAAITTLSKEGKAPTSPPPNDDNSVEVPANQLSRKPKTATQV